MKPLLEITSVPIVLEYKVRNARVQRVDSNATLEVSKGSSGYRVRSRPIKMSVDTVESNRRSMPRVTAGASSGSVQPRPVAGSPGATPPPPRQNVSAATYSATAQMLGNGQVRVDMRFNSEAVAQIESRIESADSKTDHAASQTKTLDFPENLSVIYEIDKMSFDWSASMKNFEMEFIPGAIEFSVSEYPSVTIEYVGDPIYVPPSANPNVKTIDKLA